MFHGLPIPLTHCSVKVVHLNWQAHSVLHDFRKVETTGIGCQTTMK